MTTLAQAFDAFVTKVENNFTYLKSRVDSLLTSVGLKASASDLTTHTGNTTVHITSSERTAWNAKADASDLTTHTGNTDIHVTTSDKSTWNAKQDAITSTNKLSADNISDGTTNKTVTATEKTTWNGKADASDLTTHTGNTTAHITSSERTAWNAKQDALTSTQLNNIAAVANKADASALNDYYTKTEMNTLLSGKLKKEVVSTLPAVADAAENTIYLVPNSGSGSNVKDEYILVNGAFEKIGSTDTDLSGYVAIADLISILEDAEITEWDDLEES